MKIRRISRVQGALMAVAMVVSGMVGADAATVQFAAEMVRRAPDGQVTIGKMYVGDGRIRMEMNQKGQEIIRISDRNRHMEWVLFPADKTYLERGAPTGQAAPAPTPSAPASAETDPCAGTPGMTCRRVGVEDVNGRPAVKWEMSRTDQGRTLTGAQWLDVERGLPLKHLMPNGQTMELKLVGKETLEGRVAEKWELVTTTPNQQPNSTFQWYDPELKLAVREEFPGGYVSELRGIRVGPQPDDLFTVPAGYTRKALPQGGQPPQPQ